MMSYAESRFGKNVEQMNLQECKDALITMENDAAEYEKIGQGISTKETALRLDLEFKIRMWEDLSPSLAESMEDVRSFRVQAAQMFRSETDAQV